MDMKVDIMAMMVKWSPEDGARHGSKTSRQEAGSRLTYSNTEVGPEHEALSCTKMASRSVL